MNIKPILQRIISLFICIQLMTGLLQAAEIVPFCVSSPMGTYIALVNEKQINVYSTADGTLVFKNKGTRLIAGAGFSNDDSYLTISNEAYNISAYHLKDQNNKIWQSDLKPFVDIPPINASLAIVYDANNDHILQVNQGEAILLDAGSGEFLGYEQLDHKAGPNEAPRVITAIAQPDSGFRITYNIKSSHTVVDLSIEGYGQTSQNSVSYPALLGGMNAKTTISYTNGNTDKYSILVNGNEFTKLRVNNPGDLLKATTATSGTHFAIQNQQEIHYFAVQTGKTLTNFDVAEGEELASLSNNTMILGNAVGQSYSLYDPVTGNLINRFDKADDFKYQGTALAKGKFTKEATTIFFDDFNDNENEWSMVQTKSFSKTIENGYLKMSSISGKTGTAYWNNKIEVDQFRDFDIEVSMKMTGVEQGKYSFFWGRKSKPSMYHSFYIKDNNAYGVWEYSHFWIAHKNYVQSDIVSADFNKILIRKSGDQYYYYLNDSLVHTMPFEGFHGNKVGFSCPAGAELLVDYIKVDYTSPKVYNSTPIFSDDFNDNSNKWASGLKEGRYNQTIDGGYFRYENMHTNTYSKWNDRIFLDDAKDWELEASIKMESGNSNYALALIWGKDKESTKRYRFGFARNGKFVIDHYNGSSWTNLSGWSFHNGLKMDSYNVLKIRKKGKSYKFYINGRLVENLKPSYGNAYSYGPRVGLDVPPSTVAHIAYIKASYINPRTETQRYSCPYYIPYMHPKAEGNNTNRLLIGGIMRCDGPPAMFKGHGKNLTYRQNVAYTWVTYYSKEEADLGWQKLIKQFDYTGYANWNHSLKCFESCR